MISNMFLPIHCFPKHRTPSMAQCSIFTLRIADLLSDVQRLVSKLHGSRCQVFGISYVKKSLANLKEMKGCEGSNNSSQLI